MKLDLPPLPKPLLKLLGPKAPKQPVKVFPPLSPQKLNELHTWLAQDATPAVQGASGRKTLFAVAARATERFRAPIDQLTEAMWDHYNPRCTPPWNPNDPTHDRDFNDAIYNANRTCKHVVKSAAEAFEPLDPVAVATEAQPQSQIMSTKAIRFTPISEIALNLDQEELIEDVWDLGAHSTLYGLSNVGKTFLILSRAAAIVSNRPWFGKKVTSGAVVYIAFEGKTAIARRIEALRRNNEITNDAPFFLYANPIPITEKKERKEFITGLLNLKTPIRLIIIDTFSHGMGHCGLDENKASDVNRWNSAIAAIAQATKAHVCQIHHEGKDAGKKQRGSTAIIGANDTSERVSRSETGELWVRNDKARDAETGAAAFQFHLKKILIGNRPSGKEVTSCVVVAGNAAKLPAKEAFGDTKGTSTEALSLIAVRALTAAKEVFAASNTGMSAPTSIAIADWHDHLRKTSYAKMGTGAVTGHFDDKNWGREKKKLRTELSALGFRFKNDRIYPPKNE